MTTRRFWATVAVWAFLSVGLWASGAEPDIIVLGGVIAVVAAGSLTAYDIARRTTGVSWSQGQPPPTVDWQVINLRKHVKFNTRYDAPLLHETLINLVDDRLLAHHGVDRAATPEAAYAVLTPRLQRLTVGPSRRMATTGELERILTDIEEL